MSGPVRFFQSRQCGSHKQSLPPNVCYADFFKIEVIALAECWSSMPLGEREIFRSVGNMALVMEGSGS